MTLKGFLAANQLPIGIVFSLATKVHRSPHCCNRTRPDSISSLHKRLATLFMQVQNARVEGPWNLSLRFQKAASVRQCVTWFDPMQRAPKSPFHESVMVEPKLLWRLQDTAIARSVNCLCATTGRSVDVLLPRKWALSSVVS